MTWELILLLSTCCCAGSHVLLHSNLRKMRSEIMSLRRDTQKEESQGASIEDDLTRRLEILQRARFADVTPRRMRTR